jgi:hypothetical protein
MPVKFIFTGIFIFGMIGFYEKLYCAEKVDLI